MHYGSVVRGYVTAVLCLIGASAFASASRVIQAKIASVDDKRFVFTTGSERIEVDAEKSTRFWRNKESVDGKAFQAGEPVVARVNTEKGTLRELADPVSSEWLGAIRGTFVPGEVSKLEEKTLTLTFEDSSRFTYRLTPKSELILGGQTANWAALQPGQRLWVRGRTLSTLDTSVLTATDTAPAQEIKSSRPPKQKSPSQPTDPIRTNKILTGRVTQVLADYHIIDLRVDGRIIHVLFTAETIFRMAGVKSSWRALEPGLDAEIAFRRDRFGRIIALKIDLS